MIKNIFAATIYIGALTLPALYGIQHPTMPPGMTHDEHAAKMKEDAQMKRRGAIAMGFDQDTTSHHFYLYPDGGAIEVGVKDAADGGTRQEIRTHLKEIRNDFSRGLFDKPLATHDETPPGVPTMEKLKARISYTFAETKTGGRVRIKTRDPEALSAIHGFLRYQIREHATGDEMKVVPAPELPGQSE